MVDFVHHFNVAGIGNVNICCCSLGDKYLCVLYICGCLIWSWRVSMLWIGMWVFVVCCRLSVSEGSFNDDL